MIREVLGAVAKSLKSEFGYNIYSDEVARGFQTPCFFITPIITTSRVNKNLAERQLTVSLSYFSKDDKKNMMECAEIFQRITDLFRQGVTIGTRFIHTQNIGMVWAGEQNDVMQVDIAFTYIVSDAKDTGTNDMIEEVYVEMKKKE